MNDKIEEIDYWDAENEPEAKFAYTVYRIQIPGKRRNEYKTGVLPFVYVGVADDGLISIEPYTSWEGKKEADLTYDDRRNLYEWLTEWELAEWKRIGPEDSELFATDRLTNNAAINWDADHPSYDEMGQ